MELIIGAGVEGMDIEDALVYRIQDLLSAVDQTKSVSEVELHTAMTKSFYHMAQEEFL